jgi:ATP-binding cassette subfamily B protein
MRAGLAKFLKLLPSIRRWQLLFALLLMTVGAVAEMVTIGSAMPFLVLVSNPASGILPPRLLLALDFLGGSPVAGAALVLIAASVVTAGINLSLAWFSQRLVISVGNDLASMLFSRTLHLPYSDHIRRNSSHTLAAVEKAQKVVFGVIQPAMQALIASGIAVGITILLLLISPLATAIAVVCITVLYILISRITRPRLHRNSSILAQTIPERTKTIQEALGGIRDVILDRSEGIFETKFQALDRRYRHAQGMNQFISLAPRYVIEAAGLVSIATVVLFLSLETGGFVAAIPVLGAFALGAQRLLPLLQQVYHGWSHVSGNRRVFLEVMELLEMPIPERPMTSERPEPIPFERGIRFDRVTFHHQDGRFALSDLNLHIKAGEHLGITGATGSGKSTLLDLLMGLIEPSRGTILIDGRPLTGATRAAWQAALAHVPQAVYLADASMAANIVFPRPPDSVDEQRLFEAVRAAQLETFVATLDEGLQTRVGERGINLSGGQRQRIGIARALHREPRLLILDEATSALDEATERAVLEAIHSSCPDLTLVLVAHRSSTLAACHRVIHVDDGTVRQEEPLIASACS